MFPIPTFSGARSRLPTVWILELEKKSVWLKAKHTHYSGTRAVGSGLYDESLRPGLAVIEW